MNTITVASDQETITNELVCLNMGIWDMMQEYGLTRNEVIEVLVAPLDKQYSLLNSYRF